MRLLLAAASVVLVAACGGTADRSDPASDAPESRGAASAAFKDASSYSDALKAWRTAEDVNAWIGAKFEYDMPRAMLLSETQRERNGRLPIHSAEAFFSEPKGVCVDLSRFAVETLRAIEPAAKAGYVMIEFAPVSIAGNTLRRHWVASYQRDGRYYFFADSKRPGYIAGPYASAREFIAEYARYRGREIVAFRELESFERKSRALVGTRERKAP